MKMRLLVLLTALAMTACAGLLERADTSGLVLQYATLKVVEQGDSAADRAARAENIIRIAGDAKRLFDADGFTIGLLEQAIRDRIAPLDLAPSDTLLVNALITIALDDLNEKVGQGVLSPEQLYRVNWVLDQVISAARLYVG